MGALSSKSKSANITLLRKSSNSDSDATNSRYQEDSSDAIASTPSKDKILPFDPRSPAESFNRTPITVCARGNDVDTPLVPSAASASAVAVKVLDVDPRSPSQQVSRTPIVVESPTTSKRLQDSTPLSSKTATSQGTSTAAAVTSSSPISPKTNLANICTSSKSDCDDDINDPRSPTVTVPRTPLEDKQFQVSGNSRDLCDGITKRLLFNQSACETTTNYDETELQDMEQNATDDSAADSDDGDDVEGKDSTKDTDVNSTGGNSNRKPLASVQNGGGRSRGTPRAMLQAKQCRTLEEEFSKNQRNILSQLVQDDSENIAPVPSTTQFVEEI